MKRLKGHDTGSLVISKVAILEAVRMAAGSRQNIVEVCLPNVLAPEVLSYEGHLAKYGFPLEPGHSQKFEHYTKPIGYPVPKKTEEEPGEKEQGRAFRRPTIRGGAHTPVLGKRGQGEGGKRGRDKGPRKRERRPRNPLLHALLSREHLGKLCATLTQAEIAEKIHCSRGYLCLKLKEFGLKAVSGQLPKTDHDPEIIRLAKTMTIGDLAKHFRKSRTTIFQKLTRLGIKAVRGKCGPKRGEVK